MKRIAIALLMMADLAHGAWSAAMQTPWEHPRQGATMLREAYSSAVERYEAQPFGSHVPPEPSFWRTTSGDFQAIKEALRDCIDDGFVGGYGLSGVYFADPFQAQEGVYTITGEIPVLSSTAALWKVMMPTNYFEYTPFRAMAGFPACTNDTLIDYRWKWTNSYTVAGGNNFPPGRTNWYTWDYGFARFTNIMGILIWTRPASKTWATSNSWEGNGSAYWYAEDPAGTAWAAAQSAVSGTWAWNDARSFLPPQRYTYGRCRLDQVDGLDVTSKVAAARSQFGQCVATYNAQGIPTTNIPYTADFYARADAAWNGTVDQYGGYTEPTQYVFSAQGASSVSQNWTRYSVVGPQVSSTCTSAAYGIVGEAASDPGIPDWCIEPEFTNATFLGWVATNPPKMLLKWDMTYK